MLTDKKSMMCLQEKKRANIFLSCVSFILIIFKTMPIFQGYFTAYAELVFVIVGCFLILPIKTKTIAILPITIIFFVFQTFCREDALFLEIYNVFHGSFMVLLAAHLLDSDDRNKEILIKTFWILIISITITQITSIVGLEKYPLIARYGIMGNAENIISAAYGANVSAAKLNIGGYGLVYLAPIYSSCLYALMKKKMFSKFLFIGHVLLTLYFIFVAQFMIGLLIYIATIICIFMTNADIKKIVISLIIIAIFFFFFKNLFVELFSYLSDKVESDVLSARFEELALFLSGKSINGTDIIIRLEVYEKSFDTFLENFLWGGKLVGAKGGGHSAILDYMAQGGMWALIVLILFFKTLYNKITEKFKGMYFIKYINFSFVMFLIVCLFNTMFYLGTLSIFVFCLAGFSVIASKKAE